MKTPHKPLQVTVYQDVLCSWCYLADLRLDVLRQELGEAVRWSVRPYPLRLHDVLPTEREKRGLVEEVQRAQRESDATAPLLSTDLWLGGDPPRSSVPALAALEAARLQGPQARAFLARAMQRAALEQGVNVSRTDVVFELAARVGLAMNEFSAAFRSEETRRLILDEHRDATARGVRGVPTLVIGGRWMLCGLRELTEYREHILACMGRVATPRSGSSERLVH
ncbi:thioredoxin domain-containing protein [Myxococcus stipitatus DSM 14675]|uniref:Thioredoxin domain-containing protein n=1 Tax=Myxococcus stipitatus (strain DSM 14675 / JCM 12634 / Mx s8) TaxID=1278073 RepID=L7U5F8_MYXSD|nr:DsbA family protein [Myxococcus stipitatus]AGC41724.1 thioredoxin domain-containing protein [Myxococcus stipitatus DSM 14675]